MNEKTLSIKDRYYISIFVSLMILSSFFTIVSNSIVKFIPTNYHEITGTVYGYTIDSIYIPVHWLVEYDCYGDFSILKYNEMDIEIKDLMKKEIIDILNTSTYYDVCLLKKQKLMSNEKGIKVIIFNN